MFIMSAIILRISIDDAVNNKYQRIPKEPESNRGAGCLTVISPRGPSSCSRALPPRVYSYLRFGTLPNVLTTSSARMSSCCCRPNFTSDNLFEVSPANRHSGHMPPLQGAFNLALSKAFVETGNCAFRKIYLVMEQFSFFGFGHKHNGTIFF